MAYLRSSFLRIVVSTAVFTATVAAGEVAPKVPAPCAFVHANIVPMTQEGIVRDQTVVVQNGRIAQIGSTGQVGIPRGTCKIEARSKYLIPGLADAHVHLLSPNELPLYLANGCLLYTS